MKTITSIVGALLLIVGAAFAQVPIPQNASPLSHAAGTYYASGYATWSGRVLSGNTATGSQSVIIAGNAGGGAGGLQLADGTTLSLGTVFSTLTPIIFDYGQGAQETVTPTAVSVGQCPAGNLGVGGATQCVTFTGSFSNTHGQSAVVIDGSFGLQTALNYAAQVGGLVIVDGVWATMGGTNAMLTAAVPFSNVSVEDARSGIPRMWNGTPTGAALAAPTALTAQAACDSTHQFCSDANVAGAWTSGTLFGCVTLVDIYGNEGPCSTTANFTTVVSKAVDIASPAASAGAVGWIPYLSLVGGTYAQAYKVTPTAAICTLSTLSPIPACALANTTYNTAKSTLGVNAVGQTFNGGAQITAVSVNTSQHFPALGSLAMTAASLTPITNSSVTYSYAPGNRIGACPISSANVVSYAASGSSATTIPNAVATWTIPANCFNFIGAEFRVSGKFTFTDGGDSSTKVRVMWDSAGTDSTTLPTVLCDILDTATGTAAAYNGTYYCTVKVATTGATGTALVDGYANLKLAAGATTLVRDSTDIAVAASGSINLTSDARIVVYFVGTGATNNPGAQGLAAKLEVLN